MAFRRISAKKFGIVGCVVLALTLLALSICLDAYYRENRPAEPQPTEGRLFATKLSKGVWVYLTSREQLVYKLLMPSGAVLLIIAWSLNLWWKQFPIRDISRRLSE
jgi:hypothetical protein